VEMRRIELLSKSLDFKSNTYAIAHLLDLYRRTDKQRSGDHNHERVTEGEPFHHLVSNDFPRNKETVSVNSISEPQILTERQVYHLGDFWLRQPEQPDD